MMGKRQRTKSPVRTTTMAVPLGTGVSNGQTTSSAGLSNLLETVVDDSGPSGVAGALGERL